MKYILLLPVFVLCFAGCIKHESLIEPAARQEIQSPTKSVSTGGSFDGNLSIEGLKGPITIGLGNLNFEGFFSINIPTELHNWRYEKHIPSTTHNQNLSFWEDTNVKSLYVTVGNISLLKNSLTNKDICLLQTNYNRSSAETKETITKNIGNKKIFITRITFLTEGNIDPYRYTYMTHLCFVDDTVIYDIVLDNCPFDYANQIINSFTFLD